ncbi:hypothetical protein, variant [Blastomyces dermatitidis ATCC 18188]|uniref:Uncharacterized protein n=1 Tax=Ajellomyces dermatitidis (strain ATCC 18188 / CBS 674.68) TaxID=653446 RepID=A0A0J9EP03_AJEDA|nr:hypothetical protein BDDG_11832 [Blastomyces dermatitidis ATCC 18188]KMW66990.1 hypothetical protein, variant [Blastomyces dermatitidis ATCC 18188]
MPKTQKAEFLGPATRGFPNIRAAYAMKFQNGLISWYSVLTPLTTTQTSGMSTSTKYQPRLKSTGDIALNPSSHLASKIRQLGDPGVPEVGWIEKGVCPENDNAAERCGLMC